MMKKILSIAALLLLVGVAAFAQDPSNVTELTFQVGITDPTLAHGERPRNLINKIQCVGRMLTIDIQCVIIKTDTWWVDEVTRTFARRTCRVMPSNLQNNRN